MCGTSPARRSPSSPRPLNSTSPPRCWPPATWTRRSRSTTPRGATPANPPIGAARGGGMRTRWCCPRPNRPPAQTARAKKLARASDDLDRLRRGLGSRHYTDEAAVRNRLAVIGKTRRVAAYLNATASTGTDTGKPALTWEFNQQALQVEAATDGWYALLTNLDPAEAGTPGVLHRFKGQEVSERRYGNYKGPLAAAALILAHDPP